MPEPRFKAGDTNLKCPNCGTSVDKLQSNTLNPADLLPNQLTPCPNCTAYFFPENAVLQTLRDRLWTNSSNYYNYPLSIGSVLSRNMDRVEVGESLFRDLGVTSEDYEIDAVNILGANRSGVDEDDYLSIDQLHDSYQRVILGDAAIVSLALTSPTEVAITASLVSEEGSRQGSAPINQGDEIDVVYQKSESLSEITNPPWIDLLEATNSAIRSKNTHAPLPLLIGALDNYVFRQLYMKAIWDGDSPQKAMQRVNGYKSGRFLSRYDLVGDGFDDLIGVKLENSKYDSAWDDFNDDIIDTRHDVVHPTSEEKIPDYSRQEAIDWYNQTVELCLDIFDLIWF